MKKNPLLIIFYSIFFAVGIGLLIGSIAFFKSNSEFKEIADEVTAKIIRIEEYYDSDDDLHHRVYVTYSYNGTVYDNVAIGFYNSNMFEGKEITLLCDPDNPKRIQSSSAFSIAGLILLVMGLTFMLASGLPIVFDIRKNLLTKRLLKEGRVIHAIVDRIEYNTNLTVNGRHPFNIYCNYKDDYKDITYIFKSDNLWTDPSLVFPIGSYIDVVVDPNDYSKHYVKAETLVEQKIKDYT